MLLICLDNAVLAAVDAKTTDLSYSVGDIVFERGGPAQFVYVVKRGALCRFRASPEGRRSILQFLFAGDGFGFETGRYHRDTVQALTGTEVLAAVKECSSGSLDVTQLKRSLRRCSAGICNVRRASHSSPRDNRNRANGALPT